MKRILLIFITLHLSVVAAVADTNLYSGEVLVASQGEADRDEALPDALIQVLQKLSGQREMPTSPALDEALNSAGKLLLSYRYKNVDRTGSDGAVVEELWLVAQFVEPAVDNIVQQAGLARWRQERPAIQIWVVIDDGLNRQLKPVEFVYAWESMEDIASMRGLPITWPELDEEESQLIDLSLVWGGFTDYLVERGAPADGVAIIAARREGPEWSLRWNLANGENHWNWRTSDQELMFALALGIHDMADRIASENAIAASDQGSSSIDISIGEVDSAGDYARCLDYLQSLSVVTAVEVRGADPGRLHFSLQLNASPQHLAEAFSRGTVLVPARAGREYDYEFLR